MMTNDEDDERRNPPREASDAEWSEVSDRLRILVVVASRHGSTREIAGVLAQEFVTEGASAVVAGPDCVADLASFDGIVVGSAVYLGRWLKPAREFVKEHAPELAAAKVWLFSSGPLGVPHESDLDADHLRWLSRLTEPLDHHEFGGRLDNDELGPIESLLARGADAPAGDFRDWDDIRTWARCIARDLVRAAQ